MPDVIVYLPSANFVVPFRVYKDAKFRTYEDTLSIVFQSNGETLNAEYVRGHWTAVEGKKY